MRLLLRIVLIAILVLIILVIAGYIYLFPFDGLETVVNSQIDAKIEASGPLKIEIGEISGGVFSGLVVERVTVTYDNGTVRIPLANIPRIVARYTLTDLLSSNYSFEAIYIDSAQVTVRQDSVGNWVLPVGSPGEGGGGLPAFSVADLTLNNCSITVLRPDDTVRITNVNFVASVETVDGMLSAEVKAGRFTSNYKNIGLNSFIGKFTLSDGKIIFKDVNIIEKDTRIRLNGVFDMETTLTDVNFDIDNASVDLVSEFIGPDLTGGVDANGHLRYADDVLSGEVSLGGEFMIASFENLYIAFQLQDRFLRLDTLYGSILGSCTVDGEGFIDFSGATETYRLDARIKNFNLANLIDNSFETDLSGSIVIDGNSFRSATMLLDIDCELFESSFDEYPVQYARGKARITPDSLLFIDTFYVDYFENEIGAEGKIEFSGDIDLNIAASLDNLDRYRDGRFFIRQPGGRAVLHASFTGPTNDPDLRGTLLSDSLWLYGLYADSCNTRFEIDRFASSPRGMVEAFFYRGAAWDLDYDSSYAFITLDSNVTEIDTLAMHSPLADVTGKAQLVAGDSLQMLTIDTLLVAMFEQQFGNQGRIVMSIDSLGFDIGQAAVASSDAALEVTGRVGFDESLDARLGVTNARIGPWLKLFEQDLPLDGFVSCRADVSGFLFNPVFQLTGGIDSLFYRSLYLGDLWTSVRYNDEHVMVDSFSLVSQTGRYIADGDFFADLSFTTDTLSRLPDRPMNISIKARDTEFDLVSVVFPNIEELNGTFVGEVDLTGSPREPHLEGYAYLKRGALKYFDLADRLWVDSAGFAMRDNQIILERIPAYVLPDNPVWAKRNWDDSKASKRRRYAIVEGVLTVKTLDNLNWDVDVTLPRDFPFRYELDDIEGRVEGDIRIAGDSPPQVTGDLIITAMKYRVEFAGAGESSPLMATLTNEDSWDMNLNIDILSNYWIENEDIDAEFAGQLNMIREDGVYRMFGEMQILRGRGYLWDKTFPIESGSRVIFQGRRGLSPDLDILASTRITGVRTEREADPETIEVAIHVTGTLENPEINPGEGSDLARSDLLPLLVANYYSTEDATASSEFGSRAAQYASKYASLIGSRQLRSLGVETFEIDPTYYGEFDIANTRITVGSFIGPAYIYGRSTISGSQGQEVGFEARLKRWLQIEGRRDEDELYHVNMKFHWEF